MSRAVILGLLVGGFAVAAANAAKCQLQQYAELPVTMSEMRAQISGTINGRPALFVADSGAFFSMLSRESADKFQLRVGFLPPEIGVRGVGGAEVAGQTTIKEFSLVGFQNGRTIKRVDFIVGGNEFAQGADGLIGQNVLGKADTEYDLANGYIRLFHTKDCAEALLAYWHGAASVGEMKIEERTPLTPHIIGTGILNGKKVRVLFDTGTWSSILTLKAAARAGIKPDNNDVAPAGIEGGIGKKQYEIWIARFDSLDLGGELIKNARLRMADIELDADMLLGADFFLSHRIYVSSDQNKIYFTYNGGSVFDLRANPNEAKSQTEQRTATTDTKEVATLDAAGYRRRGAASAERRDYQSAIADLDRAVQLDAKDPENYYQRGLVRWRNEQGELALADFDAALTIKANHVPALMSRGSLRLANQDEAGARVDFDVVEKVAENSSYLLSIAEIFEGAGNYAEAIKRLNVWIAANPRDERLPTALNDRCWSRAMLNQELDLALTDCNAAVQRGPRTSAVLDSRGFVHLRRGNFDKSITDYKASLKLQPKSAWTLYGLGLAEIKKGLQLDGQKVIEAAKEMDPTVVEGYELLGLTP